MYEPTYNPIYEPTDENLFGVSVRYLYKWKDLYPYAQEMMPRNILEDFVKVCCDQSLGGCQSCRKHGK